MSTIRRGRSRVFDPILQATASLPESSAAYRIVSRSMGAILYIGETNNLRRLVTEHIDVGKLPQSRIVH